MEKVNYKQLYQKLTKGLSQKTKDIFDRRFGMKTGNPETLEAIGKTFNITRERVRQIEEVGFNYVKSNNKELLDEVYADFARYFESKEALRKKKLP
jgi:DNA-directed RNA polymerase sigma subunit (sigma70/sigma32)